VAATTDSRTEIGRGVYSLAELRSYVAFEGSRKEGSRTLDWLTHALNPVERAPRRPNYTFGDLVSLFVVRELRRRGVRVHVIRAAEGFLRRKWKTDRPFVSEEIKTDGRRVFTDDWPGMGQIESADMGGQQVMRELIKDRLTTVEYDDGNAAYWTPMPGILIDPRVQFGEPVIAGTRVPVEAVEGIARRADIETAARRLGISLSAARSARAFSQRLVTAAR